MFDGSLTVLLTGSLGIGCLTPLESFDGCLLSVLLTPPGYYLPILPEALLSLLLAAISSSLYRLRSKKFVWPGATLTPTGFLYKFT